MTSAKRPNKTSLTWIPPATTLIWHQSKWFHGICGFQIHICIIQKNFFAVVVQSLSAVRLFVTPWAALSFTLSHTLLRFRSTESVMSSNHLIFIFCSPLFSFLSIFPSIRIFSSELSLHIRWTKYWSFSLSISFSNQYSGLMSFLKIILLYFTFQYCIGFAIHQHESAAGIHVFPNLKPLPPPSPYHLTGSSQCTSPKHPVSCIEPID